MRIRSKIIRKSYSKTQANIRVTFLCFICFWIHINIHAQETYDLKRCLQTVRSNNIELKNLKIEKDKAAVHYKSALYNMYPDLDANIRTGNNYGLLIDPTTNVLFFGNTFMNTYQFNSRFNLFSGFYNRYLKRLSLSQIETSQYLFEKRFNEISLELTFLYYQMWLAHENAELLKKSLDNYQKRKKYIEGSVRNEVLHKRNLYNIDYLIAQAETEIISFETIKEKNKALLMVLLSLNVTEQIIFDFSSLENIDITLFDYTIVIELAKNNFPELKLGTTEIQNAEYIYKQACSASYPELIIEGQLGTKTSTNNINESYSTQFNHNKNQYIGLNLNIPIFKNYNNKQLKEIALLDIEIARNNAQNLLLELENNVYQAVMDYNNALKLYNAIYKQFEAIEQEYQYAVKLFEIGNMGLFEFTEISERYLDVEKDLLTAKTDYLLKHKIIEFYTGND